MPGISGLEFSHQAAAQLPDAQIIILTGYGDMKSAVEAMRAGAYDYLTKPVDLDRLLQTLRQAQERRNLIIENRDLLRRVTEANRLKAEFMNGMSHEVRTPLGHITGFAQILQDTVEGLTEKQERYIENIQGGATRLLDLFDKILSFSTLKSGDVQVNPEPGNVEGILKTAVEASGPLAADLNLTLEVGETPSAEIWIDRTICSRVLELLVDNAIKYNEEGGRVTLSGEMVDRPPEGSDLPKASAAAGWLLIHVQDTGIGIPEGQLEHIFGLFTQADASFSRPYEGAGIGLALARSLARIHGGTIQVQSVPTQGSTFTLILPLSAVTA